LAGFRGGGNGDIRAEDLGYERRIGGTRRVGNGKGGV
jgi:hypothetical protein